MDKQKVVYIFIYSLNTNKKEFLLWFKNKKSVFVYFDD